MTTERNITFPIYREDGTPFHGLVLHKATYDSVVMSLGDKITGDVYYKDNELDLTMKEYIELDGVKFTIVNPPTITKEGMVADNGELKGTTKYSFEFYHPMYMLTNIPFTDVAVQSSEEQYKSQDTSFSWAGYFVDFINKIEKNLQLTEWTCEINPEVLQKTSITNKFSDVLTFDKNTIGDALKTEYDTWSVPFIIDVLDSSDSRYNDGKRYLIHFGNPTNEVYETQEDKEQDKPYIFKYGKGLGLKNNSATPKNNKIITRIAGYGSERNVPWGYPQIEWWGEPDATTTGKYPLYEGIVGGELVKLVKHPFTRKHLMPSVYVNSVYNKVRYNTGEIIDYYDALDSSKFPNTINPLAPSYEIHEFEDIYPELGAKYIVEAYPIDTGTQQQVGEWDDTIDDEGNYRQSYFKVTLPVLDFDIYACAAITQEMQINMRSGACIGCTFNIQVDWEDYKLNFYSENGTFMPQPKEGYDGELACRRDFTKYPDSRADQITLICEKDMNTFGTLMPNRYQYPQGADQFVILGISLPSSYIADAQGRLDDAMEEYMLENNVHYFDYPFKFDEYFLTQNPYILQQISNNTTIRFEIGGVRMPLYVKQFTIRFGESPLPQYSITLTDDIDIVLNQIGQVTEDVSRMRVQVGALQTYLDRGVISEIRNKLSRVDNDSANGYISFLRGLSSHGDVSLFGKMNFTGGFKSNDYQSGGNQGTVLYPDENGEWHFETDYLDIRRKLTAKEVEILKVSHIGGSQILSPGSMVINKVEMYDAVGNLIESGTPKYYRCYFEKEDDDGNIIDNTFAVNDQAYCMTFNLHQDSEGNLGNHYWWRLVLSVGTNYIDVSNNTVGTGYAQDSDAPKVGDNVVTLGNRTTADRQNAIVLAGAGANNPYFRLYQGINSFSLANKVTTQISPYGSWITVTDSNGQSTNIANWMELLQDRIDDVVTQTDKQMVLWFGDYMPTLQNEPASEWVAADTINGNTDVQESHIHDMFYNRSATAETGGRAWEFILDNNTFQWVEITNQDIIEALERASHAQDTADGKRRVFVAIPQPPYDEGDLWVNAKFPTTEDGVSYPPNGQYIVDDGETETTYTETNPLYDNDVLRCTNSKTSSGEFSINDWTPAQYYTKNNIDSKITQTSNEILTQVGNIVDNSLEDINDAIDAIKGNPPVSGVSLKSLNDAMTTLDGQVSAIAQTQDEISLLVFDSETGYSIISQQVGDIYSLIYNPTTGYSSLSQTVGSLSSTVATLNGNYSTLSQTVDTFQTTVNNTLTSMQSQITQNATNISLSVSKNELETVGIHLDGVNSTITLSADKTIVSDDLVVKQVETKPINDNSYAKVVIHGSTMEVFGATGIKNIEFGVDEEGYATMKYFDNDGNFLYDLGPAGLRYLQVVNASFNRNVFYTALKTDSTAGTTVSYYRFSAKRVQGIITPDDTYTETATEAQNADGKWFTGSPIYDSNGNLLNLANNSTGVRYAYDKIVYLQTMVIIPATTATECKEWVQEQYGLSDSDVSRISFAGTTDGEFWTLANDVRVQNTRRFNNGVMIQKYIIWQV